MSPEQQRIAIAEACGWRKMRTFKEYWASCDHKTDKLWWATDGSNLPDYLNDLNAMHEAVDTLHPADLEEYGTHLLNLVRRFWKERGKITDAFTHLMWGVAMAQATAPQRAEAFLRTLGKWEEDV